MNKHLKSVVLGVLILALLIVLVFPFVWAISSSVKTENQLMMTPATLLPRNPRTHAVSFTAANYQAVFTNTLFLRSFVNSIIVAVSVTLASLCFGSFAAFALAKLRFRGKGIALYGVLSMTMFPQIAVLTGLYALMHVLHLPPLLSMICSYMLFTLPFSVWVLQAYFRGIPDSLLEAAAIDGASRMQAFRRVLLPLTAPALVTTGLLAFIAAWNEYVFALTFTAISPKSRTVTVALALFSGEVSHQQPFGEIMAATVLVTLPLLILVLIFQKKIIDGLTAGAEKQ